jgi:AraC-like DNA-binding protein
MTATLDHFVLESKEIAPGAQWRNRPDCWVFHIAVHGRGSLGLSSERGTLQEGDAVTVPPRRSAVFQAAEIGLRMTFFCFRPEKVNGLMSVSDHLRLGSLAETTDSLYHFPRGTPLATSLYSVISPDSEPGSLLSNCRFLQAITHFLRDASPPGFTRPQVVPKPQEDVREILKAIPVPALLAMSTDELARKCHYSRRHLNRLFHELFGMSIHQYRSKIRLEHAASLLSRSSAKVIDVAGDCGFSSLGSFASQFKKEYGTTPSRWRNAGAAA